MPDSITTLTGLMDTLRPLARKPEPGQDTTSAYATAAARAADPGYNQWLRHVGTARGCIRPIRLSGRIHTVNTATGEILATRTTATMPDEVVYIPCGDRRAEVCPSCAEMYRADTYHMIKSGLTGGKGTPDTVNRHPAVFTTLTAPSFGPVHTHSTTASGKMKPCRPRRTMTLCPHGRPTWCSQRHPDGSKAIGKPLCPDCYDYAGHAVWNAFASELWRRTTQTLRRLASRLGNEHGIKLDVSFGKVAEYQHRGIVHFHAIIRLDQRDPDDPDAIHPPPPDLNVYHLDNLITQAVTTTAFRTPPHPGGRHLDPRPEGWLITWGSQLVNRPLSRVTGAQVTEEMVAAYVAKYATKSTEATGFTARRITTQNIRRYADYQTHAGTLIAACWDIGANPYDPGEPDHEGGHWYPPDAGDEPENREVWKHTYGKLRRWAHMFGFGGHFTTRSRRYGPTRKALKTIRRVYQRSQQLLRHAEHHTADHLDDDTTLIVSDLAFAGIGYLTTGDAELALTAAAKAREHRNTQITERKSIA